MPTSLVSSSDNPLVLLWPIQERVLQQYVLFLYSSCSCSVPLSFTSNPSNFLMILRICFRCFILWTASISCWICFFQSSASWLFSTLSPLTILLSLASFFTSCFHNVLKDSLTVFNFFSVSTI